MIGLDFDVAVETRGGSAWTRAVVASERTNRTNAVSTLSETLFSTRNRTLVRNLGFEVTQPWPERALVQVHFRNANGAPLFRLREHAAVLAIDRGEHPVARHVFVSAADDVNLVLARAGA